MGIIMVYKPTYNWGAVGLMVGLNLSKSKIFGCHVYWRLLISHLYL